MMFRYACVCVCLRNELSAEDSSLNDTRALCDRKLNRVLYYWMGNFFFLLNENERLQHTT